MKRHGKIFGLLVVFLGLLFLGCLAPKTPDVPGVESSSLVGEWIIVEQTTAPLAIIPLCKSIRKGTTVKFTRTTFEVYVDASEKPCDTYDYKTGNNHISFIKADMLWLCTYELAPKSLKLTSTNFFSPDESKKAGAENELITANQPVIITLKRK